MEKLELGCPRENGSLRCLSPLASSREISTQGKRKLGSKSSQSSRFTQASNPSGGCGFVEIYLGSPQANSEVSPCLGDGVLEVSGEAPSETSKLAC